MELTDILDMVSVLYRKYGIRSVTMDDVARELGISKKTLYLHVTDKADLVRKVVGRDRECCLTNLMQKSVNGLNAIEDLIEMSRRLNELMRDHSPSYFYDLKKYYPETFRNLMIARRQLMYECMLDNIRKGKDEGLYRRELDEEIIAKLHLLRIETLRESELFREEEVHSTKFFREVFIYHIHGLATQKGLAVLEKNMPKINVLENHVA